jgi:phage baseplate assembly protein gpV
VRIEGNYSVDSLLELEMDIGVNKHGVLTYGGYVSEDAAMRYIQQKAEGQTVDIYLRDVLEFCGHIQKLTAEQENGYWYLKVELVTSTELMDVDKHNRFFQDYEKTYEDIIAEAYNDSKLGNLIADGGNGVIGVPILQYCETDWEFTLRMAGNLNAVIIPDVTAEEPQVVLGIPQRRIIEEPNDIAYSIARSGSNLRYMTKSDNRYRLGDCVRIHGNTCFVMHKCTRLEQGEIVEHYVLSEKYGLSAPFFRNKLIAGLELAGTVVDHKEDMMQVLLDIDKNRNTAAKTWFYYAPVTNNGMYSMPLLGEKVMLNWQSGSDDDVIVVRPVRSNSSELPHRSERHFMDENGNHLQMLPDMMEYTNSAGKITWIPDVGIDIATGKKVDITAQGDVVVEAGGQVRVYSPERITASKVEVENIMSYENVTEVRYKTNSYIDMIGKELHINSENSINIESKVNHHESATLPKKLPSFEIEVQRANKLFAAMPSVLNARDF